MFESAMIFQDGLLKHTGIDGIVPQTVYCWGS